MNPLQNLAFEGHLVRMQMIDGDPWFVATDLCAILGIKNTSQAVEPLDEDEKGICLTYTTDGYKEALHVSFGGAVSLALRTRQAMTPGTVPHRLRRWLTGDVALQIWKTGAYIPEGHPAQAASQPYMAEPPEIDLTHAPLAAKVSMLHFVLKVRGREAAVAYMPSLGLPPLAHMPSVSAGQQIEAEECLSWLLSCQTEEGEIRQLVAAAAAGDVATDKYLRRLGIIVRPAHADLAFASSHRGMAGLFKGSRWADKGWYKALLALPGAARGTTMNFGGHASHSVLVPLDALGEGV